VLKNDVNDPAVEEFVLLLRNICKLKVGAEEQIETLLNFEDDSRNILNFLLVSAVGQTHCKVRQKWHNVGVKIVLSVTVLCDPLQDFKDTLLGALFKEVHLLQHDASCSTAQHGQGVFESYLFVSLDAGLCQINKPDCTLHYCGHALHQSCIYQCVHECWEDVHKRGQALDRKELYLVAKISDWVSLYDLNQNVHILLCGKAVHLILLSIG